jgi:hypothetical protein
MFKTMLSKTLKRKFWTFETGEPPELGSPQDNFDVRISNLRDEVFVGSTSCWAKPSVSNVYLS